MKTRKKQTKRKRRMCPEIAEEGSGYFRKYIDILLDENYHNKIQYYNWCYFHPTTRTVLLTDFRNGNNYFNQFKNHVKGLLGPKAKIKFEKHGHKKLDWHQNILVKIKN